MKSVGIIGQGFVGNAVYEGLKPFFSMKTYDIDPQKMSNCASILEVVDESDSIIFVCLPTPMNKDGTCDINIVRKVLLEIDESAKLIDKKIISVIKSTVPPGTTKHLNKALSFTTCVFSPEFLTEANSVEDFKNQTRIIVGGPRPQTTQVKTLFRKPFPNTPIIKTSSDIAEMVKYFTNCFLATKVSFSNELKQICDKTNIDYDKVVEYALYDRRIGGTHLSVPGPDGNLGFGGHCFPKDLNALIAYAENLSIDPVILKSVWEKNLSIREEAHRDWINMIGRAVNYE